jgi:hypothetical protein
LTTDDNKDPLLPRISRCRVLHQIELAAPHSGT